MSLWADTGTAGAKFGRQRKSPGHLEAVERVKDWTRERFALADDETILLSESVPSLPGFPPSLTGVAFWKADGTRYHFRVYKRVEEVAAADLPPAWMMAALAWDGFECECC